ncbi:MAG: arsenate reductase [Myxococcota bacterium]
MLKELGVDYVYRNYEKDPLDAAELRDVLTKLGMGPRDILRSRDAKANGLTGEEDDDTLIGLMAKIPRLVQRPIAIRDDGKAIIARPADTLSDFLVS